MQSHATVTTPTQEDQKILLLITKQDYETLNEIYGHLGTISFNNTTIPSPLVIALKMKPAIDITTAQAVINSIIKQIREAKECADGIKDMDVALHKRDCELLTRLICYITELSIKHHDNLTQLLEKTISISAVSALFIELSYTTLKDCQETLRQTYLHIRKKSKTELLTLCNALNTTIKEADDHLSIALEIDRRIASQLDDDKKDGLLRNLGVGYYFYMLLESMKAELVAANSNARLACKFNTSYFLDKLTENQRLQFNPSLEVDTLFARYQHAQLHTKNIRNIDNAYEYVKSRLNQHYKNEDINEAYFNEITYTLSVTRIRAAFERCNNSIKQHELDSARKLMLEIEMLFNQIRLSDVNLKETGNIGHRLVADFFTLSINSLSKRSLTTSASTLDGLLSDIQLLKRNLNLYKDSPRKPLDCETALKDYDRRITFIEDNVNLQKQAILLAEANALKLSDELDEKIKQYEVESQKILAELTKDTEGKIKQKPEVKAKPKIRPAMSTPKAATHEAMPEQETPDSDRGMRESLAIQAKTFFENNDYRNYLQFVNQQSPEDRAEALLYAADYNLLKKEIDTAVQLYEESYTLAKQESTPNDDLIANLKLSLTITHAHIEQRLTETKAREERLNQSRLQYIMYLGYYCAANDPQAVSISSPRETEEEYYKYIHEVGLACFKNIGLEKQAFNIPRSSYSAQREFIAREMKRLTKANENTKRVLNIIKEEPASALIQNNLFRPAQTARHPSNKKAQGAKRRGKRPNNH